MRHRALATVIAVAAAALPTAALAAGDPAREKTLLVYAVCNFVLFVGLLYFLLRKPLREFLDRREHELNREIERVQQLRADFDDRIRGLTERLDGIDRESKTLVEEIVSAAERERDRILAEADALARSIQHSTEQRVSTMEREIRAGIVDEITRRVLADAEGRIRDAVDDDLNAGITRANLLQMGGGS